MSETTGGGLQRHATFVLLDNGMVQLHGGLRPIDISTQEGVAEAEDKLNAEEKMELLALLRARGLILRDGVYMPSDAVGGIPKGADAGPKSTTPGVDELDLEIAKRVFEPAGVPSPFNANTTPQLQAQIQGSPQYDDAVRGLTSHVANPTDHSASEFIQRMEAMAAKFPHGNIMELLFVVFKGSIQETNEDKKYFLKKLMMYNKMGEALSDYLSDMVDKQHDLDDMRTPEMSTDTKSDLEVEVPIKELDLSGLDPDGNPVWAEESDRYVVQTGLVDQIKDIESQQENLRNKRQMATTSFQNFDQKTNQLYNLMSQVVKTMYEMRHAPIKNML